MTKWKLFFVALIILLSISILLLSSATLGQVGQQKVIYTFTSGGFSPNQIRDALGSPIITVQASVEIDPNTQTVKFILLGTCSGISLSQFGKLRDQWAVPLGWGIYQGVSKEGCP